MADFSMRMMTQSVIIATVAKRRGCLRRQPSPKKSPVSWILRQAELGGKLGCGAAWKDSIPLGLASRGR